MTALAAVLLGLAVTVACSPAPSSLGRLEQPDFRDVGVRTWWPIAAALGWVLAGPVLGVLAGAAAAGVPTALHRRGRAQQEAVERSRALEALGLLAAELRAGRAPADALAGAAEVATDGSRSVLLAAAAAGRLGGDVPAALRAHRSSVPQIWSGLATCWSVCVDMGHGLATAVERLEEALRAAEGQRRAVEAELAGPRATAALLAALPLAGIGLAGALGADPLHVLLRTPIGLACLVVGLALDLAGWCWTRVLVDRALRA